tara:strand:+ start:520 stop:1449 length:930 start_codon:yes stop_codon:yes gene_type:complete
MGKGKQSVPADQTVVQSNLPKYVRPYFERLLDRTEAESLRDYETYEGQRLAEEAQDTLDSRQRARDVAGTPIAGLPAAQAATTAGVGRALQGMGFEAGQFDSAAADQYMSPYMQQVVDVQKERAILDAQRQGAGRGAQAVQAGAFGGSRAAVQEALAGEALNRQLAEIQASGQQQAFEQAQQQFERDRAARADAERIGLGAGELAGQQARSLADLGRLAREGDIESARLLEQVGKDITAREQAGLDLAYQDFVRQRDFPRENLQFLSSILRGVPITPSTETTTMQAYNPIQQLLGTGISALGLYKGLGG